MYGTHFHYQGNIYYIQNASKYGNVTVIISRDSVVKKLKQRETILDEEMRKTIIENIKGVNKCILGNEEGKWYEPVLQENPHLFLMGCNQPGDCEKFEKIIKEKGGRTLFRRLNQFENSYHLRSSSEIRRRVIDICSSY